MTPHINANENDIAKIVLSPGDPLRAKYIAEKFLDNAKLVNSVRNILAYTGTYKGTEITIFSSGMGMPSMGIYSYELYKFYNVDTILRIGSCGSYVEDININDIVLIDNSYTEGNFALALNNSNCHTVSANSDINNIIKNTSNELHIPCTSANVFCGECFDAYIDDLPTLINRFPHELNISACEMEAFALFYTAKYLNKKAACLLTVADSLCKKEKISFEDREKSFDSMIILALESAIKINSK